MVVNEFVEGLTYLFRVINHVLWVRTGMFFMQYFSGVLKMDTTVP